MFLPGPLPPPPPLQKSKYQNRFLNPEAQRVVVYPESNASTLECPIPSGLQTLPSSHRAKIVIANDVQTNNFLNSETYDYLHNDTIGTSALPDPAFPPQSQFFFVSADSTSQNFTPTMSNFDSMPVESFICAGVAPVPSTAESSPVGTSLFEDFEPIYNDYIYTSENDKLTSIDQWKDYLHSDDASFANIPTTAADALAEDLSWLEEEIDQNLINEFMTDPSFCPELQPQQILQPEPQQQQILEYVYYEQPASSSSSSSSSATTSPNTSYVPIAPRPASQSPQSASNTVSPVNCFNIPPIPSDRKRRKPMTFSSAEEEYAVKRQLNNIASARSRQKKKEEIERRKVELVQLESRNRELKGQFEEYERQITTLKTILYSTIQK